MKSSLRLAVVTLVFALSGTFAVAGPYGGGQPGHPPGPDAMMAHFEELGLSDQQRDSLKKLMADSQTQREAMRKQHKDMFERMHDADKPMSPAEIDKLSAEFGKFSEQQMKQRLTLKAGIDKILTKEQRAKMQAMRKERMDKMRKRGNWGEEQEEQE